MAYKALYRTYRPQTFEEVAGQKHIVRTLKNALEKGKIAHAYLFCGPRGTGKTTMAKLFAKALNCEQGIGHQCNECSNCVEITEGSHPDVIEIDAASNNGVEQVRDLIDKVNYLPLKGKYKVYIIDEVHMMTTNAFNALLKTLEEPPAHVIFILATTEPHNILPTILSRCQRYDFTKVSDGDIKERMITILNEEHIRYEESAIDAIISLADGGVRDALSILDQILAYSGESLAEKDVYTLFGLASTKEKLELIRNIYQGDVVASLDKINRFVEGGIDLKRLNNDLLNLLKDILIYKKTKDETEILYLREEDAIEYAELIDIKSLTTMISAFLKAQIDFKSISNIKTLFEVTVLKLCTIHDEDTPVAPQPKLEVKPAPIKKEEPKVVEEKKVEEPVKEEIKPEPVPVKNSVINNTPEPTPEVEKPKEAAPDWLFADEKPTSAVVEDGETYKIDDKKLIELMVVGDKDQRKNLLSRWNELDSYLGHPTLGDVVALIRDGRPFLVNKYAVILEYDFEKLAKKINIKENQQNVSEVMSQMLNREVFVYAIPRSESVRLITAFHNLRQISQLPKANEIHFDVEELKKQ